MSRVERHMSMYNEDIDYIDNIEDNYLSDEAFAKAAAAPPAPVIPDKAEAAPTPAATRMPTPEPTQAEAQAKTPARPKRSGGTSRARRGRILSIVGTVILALSLIMCTLLIAPRILGFKTYLVASGSMVPAIPVGSMIYARDVDPAALETDDIIVFFKTSDRDVPITHRVVVNNTDSRTIITKGDANANADREPVRYDNIEGKVIWHIPMLGILALPLTKPLGKAIAVMLVLEGFLFAEVGSRMRISVKKVANRDKIN
ncbi:MAG: signal peptidase I [Lachnospiraceae bacterium]|nr:signal peptidase I [Lachnospiraceae bacterium]